MANIPDFIDRAKPMTWGLCRSCKAAIYWAATKQGKPHPLNEDGTSHFGTCPQAKSWSKKGEARCR